MRHLTLNLTLCVTLLLGTLLTSEARAENSSAPPIPTADQVRDQLNQTLDPARADCCTAVTSEFDPCDDLFAASCLNGDGSFKKQFSLKENLETKIRNAFQASPKQMGSESVDAAFSDALKKNGFEVRPDLDEATRSQILSDPIAAINEMGTHSPASYFVGFSKYCPDESKLGGTEAEEEKKLEDEAQALQKKLEQAQLQNGVDSPEAKGWSNSLAAKKNQAKEHLESALGRKYEKHSKNTHQFFKGNPSNLVVEMMRLCSDVLPFKFKSRREKVEEKKIAIEKKNQSKSDQANTRSPYHEYLNRGRLDEPMPVECASRALYDLRDQVVQIHRIKDRAKATQAKEAFIDTNLPAFLRLNILADDLSEESESVFLTDEESKSSLAVKPKPDLSRNVRNACYLVQRLAPTRYLEIYSEFFGNLALSRPTVESILSSTYGPPQRVAIEKLYAPVHQGVLDFINADLAPLPELKGTPKLARLQTSMKALKYSWLDQPPAAYYKQTEEFPLPVLDFDKIPVTDLFLKYFQDPTLSFFKEMNAFYMPEIHLGVMSAPETVNFLATVNLLAQEDPWAAMAVMAHEIGHKIGYKLSRTNGYDLTGAFKELMKCLASERSVKMSPGQTEEVISDWISTQVMAKVIASLNEGKKAAALRLSGFFCQAEADSFYHSRLNLTEAHPDTTLRMNGIFGADPRIRAALGCPNDEGALKKRKYVECTLKGERE